MALNFNSEDMFKAVESIQGPIGKKKFGPDERFWKLGRNADDKGAAQIRLIPNVIKAEDGSEKLIPYVRVYEHTIKTFDKVSQKDKFFIKESPFTVGLPCAATDLYFEMGKMDGEQAEAIKKLISRKAKFITNIHVTNDPINKENTGKRALWSFGTKLDEKMSAIMRPSESDIALGATPVNLYDVVKGAEFNLKIQKVAGFYNYDPSGLGPVQPVKEFKSNEEVEAFIKEGLSIQEWIEESHYPTYDEQVKGLQYVFSNTIYEDFLKANNSFIYKNEAKTEAPKQVQEQAKPQEQVQQAPSGVQSPSVDMGFNDDIQTPQQSVATTSQPSSSDDLAFLDDF